jgi:hypothetical protein
VPSFWLSRVCGVWFRFRRQRCQWHQQRSSVDPLIFCVNVIDTMALLSPHPYTVLGSGYIRFNFQNVK